MIFVEDVNEKMEENGAKLFQLASEALNNGDPEKSSEYLKQALIVWPESFKVYRAMGDAQIAMELYENAIHYYHLALMMSIECPDVFLKLSIARQKLGQILEAIHCLEAMPDIKGHEIHVFNRLGELHAQLGHRDQAKAYFQRVLTYDKQNHCAQRFLKKISSMTQESS